jgi:hypothetical protein
MVIQNAAPKKKIAEFFFRVRNNFAITLLKAPKSSNQKRIMAGWMP